MNKRTGYRPFFLFLLPVFFVFHGFVSHTRFIRWTDCLLLLGKYGLLAALLFLLFRWILKDNNKAALIAFLLLAFYFFFGNLHEPLRKSGIFLYHYSLMLPLFIVLMVLLTYYIARKPPATRLIRFLNWLFGLFILADGLTWAIRSAGKDTPAISASAPLLPALPPCDSCPRPDIYLLLFDEYSGSRTLRNTFHYDNEGLDSFLRSADFHILPDSRSNYSVTPFSMASMLNLAYLRGIPHPQALEPDDYTNIFEPLRSSDAVNFLLSRGYSIVNNSPYDLPEHPSDVQQPFIATGTRLITYWTLTDCMVRDVPVALKLGTLLNHLLPFGARFEDPATAVYRMNETFLDRTMQISASTIDRPRFVYMHVTMPHAPFLFDSLFRRRSPKEALTPFPMLKDYLGYLPYTNSRIRQLITTIKKNTGGKAVILFMSDHGLRYWEKDTPYSVFFRNQNAVYFPDGDYSAFYDSISNVNQFRVVFDKLFHLDLPLLKDSTILLLDKN
jgi:hypothetical protein